MAVRSKACGIVTMGEGLGAESFTVCVRVLKATLGKLLRDGAERIWVFPNCEDRALRLLRRPDTAQCDQMIFPVEQTAWPAVTRLLADRTAVAISERHGSQGADRCRRAEYVYNYTVARFIRPFLCGELVSARVVRSRE